MTPTSTVASEATVSLIPSLCSYSDGKRVNLWFSSLPFFAGPLLATSRQGVAFARRREGHLEEAADGIAAAAVVVTQSRGA